MEALSDESLLAGFASGDEDASAAFVRRFQSRVYGLALTMLRDRELADDAAQEAFARAWRYAPSYDVRRGAVPTWLLAIEYLDPSYNHFPSLHVALGCLVFFALRDRLGRLRAPLATLLAGMCLSTLFVKQHYLLDVLYGSGLAWAAWAVAFHLRPRRIEGGVFHAAIPFRKALR